MTQLELFDRPKRMGPPAVAVRTSIAAAEAIAEMAPTLRGKVYGFIAAASAGATRQEIADGLRIKLQTVCGRAESHVARVGRVGNTRRSSCDQGVSGLISVARRT